MSDARPRILIVEDEVLIRRGLCDLLAYHGVKPVGVGEGTDGLARALAETWDVVVLDVMLPGVHGLSICERLRVARSGQAVLMLTARGREQDVLDGFSAGCDDYVAKPFSVVQPIARVKALLRRQQPPGAARRIAIVPRVPIRVRGRPGCRLRLHGRQLRVGDVGVEPMQHAAVGAHHQRDRDCVRPAWQQLAECSWLIVVRQHQVAEVLEALRGDVRRYDVLCEPR